MEEKDDLGFNAQHHSNLISFWSYIKGLNNINIHIYRASLCLLWLQALRAKWVANISLNQRLTVLGQIFGNGKHFQ